ncbi:kinase-like domain-containing protein [Amylocystis lapponica]|nr:kinase-like domain-containing protein [Amylocystis lapponica]
MWKHYEESDSEESSTSSSSFDEEEVNRRMRPTWCRYRDVIGHRGFRLDTCRDVKEFYRQYLQNTTLEGKGSLLDLPGYARARTLTDENALCRDAGLPDHLFRGTRCATNEKVVIKAVHLRSREYDVVRYISSPPLRDHSMNHCIPVLDLIEVPDDNIAFIVMEEWWPHLDAISDIPVPVFLCALRQCIEHIVFMHTFHVAHLDVSVRNVLTDLNTRYACIDFEMSRRFDDLSDPRIRNCRSAETPPEVERGEWTNPYKVDIWALGILLLRISESAGHHIPELIALIKPMLHNTHEQRPTARQVLHAFDDMLSLLSSRYSLC